MDRSLRAAAVYFAWVFSLGFVIGAARVLLIAPRLGALPAVLAELPVMLTVSAFAARGCISRFAVGSAMIDRLAMGAVAFAMLMAAEVALAVLVFRTPLAQYIAQLNTPAGALGLAGQACFGAMPVLLRLRR